MTHEHIPITNDNDIVCQDCGVVLATAIDYPYMPTQSITFGNLEQRVQGFNQSNYKHFGTSHEKYYTEQCVKVFARLQNICTKEHIPARFANDAMRVVLARKRGLWSYKWQLITLIQVLQSANDKRLKPHIRHLKRDAKIAKGT